MSGELLDFRLREVFCLPKASQRILIILSVGNAKLLHLATLVIDERFPPCDLLRDKHVAVDFPKAEDPKIRKDRGWCSICIQFVLIVCWFVLLAASLDYFSSSMNSQKNVLGRQSTQGRPTTQIFSSATSLSRLQPKCWSTFCHRCPRRMTLQSTCIKMNAGSRGARMCWLQIQEKSRGMGRVDLRWIWECLRLLKMWDRLGRTCGGELHAVIKRREHREDEVMDALASGSLKE